MSSSKKIKVTKYHVSSSGLVIIATLLAIVFIVPLKYNEESYSSEDEKRPLKAFILSAYFYPVSESLGNNSLAFVMSMNLGKQKDDVRSIVEDTAIMVMARNQSSGIVMSTNYERITLHDNCQMSTVFATVQLLPNPTQISMMSNESLTDVPYKIPSYAKRDVVVCISPIYVSEQWQSFLLAAHTYKHFGAHLHLYFISAASTFYQLMHEYDKLDFFTMQPWDRVFFPFVPGHVADAYQEMEFQSLAGAQTDCILQYKESAKFVALFDLDDILIPKVGPTLVEEFQNIIGQHRHVSFLSYKRKNFDASVYNNTGFSIQAMLDSFVDKDTEQQGRIVAVPKNLNYTWMNRPLNTPNGFVSIDVTENVITHIENITWKNEEPIMNTNNDAIKMFASNSSEPMELYASAFDDIELELQFMLNTGRISEIVPTLQDFYYFYYLVKTCFEEKYYRFMRSETTNWVKNKCPGPQMCGFYQHPKIQCVHVNAKHVGVPPQYPITYYYATAHHYTQDIGCYAH